MIRTFTVATVLVLALGQSSCMLFRKRNNAVSNDPVTLQVENHNWNDIIIYAVIDGTRTRLGDVTAARSATLTVPNTILKASGMLQLVLDPLGSRYAFRTGNIMVNGGQRVRLLIENELRLSSWTVR